MLHLGVIGGVWEVQNGSKTAKNRLKTIIIAKMDVYSFWA